MNRNTEPKVCPNCGSSQITADNATQNSDSLDRFVVCEECGYGWIESFTFHEWIPVGETDILKEE